MSKWITVDNTPKIGEWEITLFTKCGGLYSYQESGSRVAVVNNACLWAKSEGLPIAKLESRMLSNK
jgi:hypothetical protein